MPLRLLSRLFVVSLGIALLLAGLFINLGSALTVQAVATPTLNRLAEPTLPANPSQADLGAQVYWLSCLPCHGDRGQGLTDEFRQTYPPEDQNCWTRGCHGDRPYANGFTLPRTVPALIGPGALAHFSDGAVLEAFIKDAMPFWKPGSLSDEDAWKVTAFLLRANGWWDGVGELSADNAGQIKIQGATPSATTSPAAGSPRGVSTSAVAVISALALVLLAVFLTVRLKKS